MKKLLFVLLFIGTVFGASARPGGHGHHAPHHHHHGHHHGHGHLTTREEQKPVR